MSGQDHSDDRKPKQPYSFPVADSLSRRLIRSTSIEADTLTGYKKSARAQKSSNGLLPPTIALGPRAAAYYSDELEAVTAARAVGVTDEGIRDLVKRLVSARGDSKVAA